MIKNRSIYENSPDSFQLLNNGVADVTDELGEEEEKTLRHELEMFVCKGEHKNGLQKILEAYVDNFSRPEQPAVWVSGFFGSGKSHLVKMLRYLWDNHKFDDGATARGLANLPDEITDLLTELDRLGKRHGGLHAISGTLADFHQDNVKLALLGLVFQSVGLPKRYELSEFILRLKGEGIYEEVKSYIEDKGKNFRDELRHMYVSTDLAEAWLRANPKIGNNAKEVSRAFRQQFPRSEDIDLDSMGRIIRKVLSNTEGEFPCTLIVLDEVEQYIGEDRKRSFQVQLVTEELSKKFAGKLIFVGTGQNSLSGTSYLTKLQGRFNKSVSLTDAAVETVTRDTVLKKKQSKVPELKEVLDKHSGEIDRQLRGTELESSRNNKDLQIRDYPILPVRRRFWEQALRVVDEPGTKAQLRTQLKIIDEAVKDTADKELGNIVGGDFLFWQVRSDLLENGVLLNEIDSEIQKLKQDGENGELRARICAVIFFLNKIKDSRKETGIKANEDTISDLLVRNIVKGSTDLRKKVPKLLEKLVSKGLVNPINDEYRLQTKESSDWHSEFREKYQNYINDRAAISAERSKRLAAEAEDRLQGIKISHGKSNTPRDTELFFSQDEPEVEGGSIPIWVRNGWSDKESSIESAAKQAGSESARVYVFIPQYKSNEFSKKLAKLKASEETLDLRGEPNSSEGQKARAEMETRRNNAAKKVNNIVEEALNQSRVYLAGGRTIEASTLGQAVTKAAKISVNRLFTKFEIADDPSWPMVWREAKNKGNIDALKKLDYSGEVEDHPVCSKILDRLNNSLKGKKIRDYFEAPPYGWPRESISASLVLLTITGHLKARRNGQTVEDITELSQRDLTDVEFRRETTVISTQQRLGIRQIFHEVGVECKAGEKEELTRSSVFVEELKKRANVVTGEPPSPDTPKMDFLDDITGQSGNDKLKAILDSEEEITSFVKQLETWEDRKEKRLPQWEELKDLFSFMPESPEKEEVKKEMKAIQEQRTLLEGTNPVNSLSERLTNILRESLNRVKEEFDKKYEEEMSKLQATEEWGRLDEEEQRDILNKHNLDSKPVVQTGSRKNILSSLKQRDLQEWENLIDALPNRFANARDESINNLTPDAKRVSIPSSTIETEEELEEWIEKVKSRLEDKIKESPIIINGG